MKTVYVLAMLLLALPGLSYQDNDLIDFERLPVLDNERVGGGPAYGRLPPGIVPEWHTLPLELTIDTVVPTEDPARPGFFVEISVRNVGDAPYMIPVSIDRERQPIQRGHLGRRYITFHRVWVTGEGQVEKESQISSSIAIADGSDTYPGSLRELGPQESIRFRFRTSYAKTVVPEGTEEIAVWAGMSETRLEDVGDLRSAQTVIWATNRVTGVPIR